MGKPARHVAAGRPLLIFPGMLSPGLIEYIPGEKTFEIKKH
jgi:hypothetical protein